MPKNFSLSAVVEIISSMPVLKVWIIKAILQAIVMYVAIFTLIFMLLKGIMPDYK